MGTLGKVAGYFGVAGIASVITCVALRGTASGHEREALTPTTTKILAPQPTVAPIQPESNPTSSTHPEDTAPIQSDGAPVLTPEGLPEAVNEIVVSKADSDRGALGTAKYLGRIYTQPDRASELLFRINVGTKLRIISSNETWLEVLLAKGKTGFILSKQVDLNNAKPSAPVAQKPDPGIPLLVPRSKATTRSGGGLGGVYEGVGSGHWISETESGKYIELEDGSLWKVDDTDEVDSALWLATEDIIVKESSSSIGGYRLINTDNHEAVGATYVSH